MKAQPQSTSGAKLLPAVTAVLAAAGLISTAHAQFTTAGTLYVDLRATDSTAGAATWNNQGTLGSFAKNGTPSLVADVNGTGIPGVLFNGTTDWYLGPTSVADLEGSSDRSIEVWVLNPSIATEETLVAWGHRGSNGQNMSMNYGSSSGSGGFGAAGHWGSSFDVGWTTAAPAANTWHHIVYTYSGTTCNIYVDGTLNTTKAVGTLNSFAGFTIVIGGQHINSSPFTGIDTAQLLSGYINAVRVHGGTLSATDVANNYHVGPWTSSPQIATLRVVASFSNTNGAFPYGGLTLGTDGSFYGTTHDGGVYGFGTVFKVTTNGQLTSLASFDGTNGADPHAGLTLSGDGSFYGTTEGGVASYNGTVFKVTTNDQLTSLASFDGTNGADPLAGLTLGADGNFYGTTLYGGTDYFFENGVIGYGTVFRVAANGQLTSLVSFAGTNGEYPRAGLALGADGSFYGTTENGGTSGYGTVFKVTTNGQLTSLVSFAATNGSLPYAGLTLGPDSNFYGTTFSGGVSSFGTVFKVTTNGQLSSLVSFAGTNGAYPYAGLTLGADGNFYGTTSRGGISNAGIIFALGLTTTPQIVAQPQSRTNSAATSATFSVSAAGAAPLSYEWRKGGTNLTDAGNLSGSSGPTLTITNLQSADAGSYDVVITNSYGSVTSAVATLTVVYPPTIVAQPQSLTNGLGTFAAFSVAATGDFPLSYQWRKDTASISGATNSTFTIAAVQAADSGNYDVIVTNPYGAATSDVAVLVVVVPGLAWRTLPATFQPGETISVRLDVTPPPAATNWSIVESFPSSWSVANAPDASYTNDLTGEMILGPFTNAQPRTISYQVASVFESPSAGIFSGYLSASTLSTNAPVLGDTNTLAHRDWEFAGPTVLPSVPVTGAAYGAGRWVATSDWGWSTTLADGSTRWTYPIQGAPYGDGSSRMAFLGGKFLWWGTVNINGVNFGQILSSGDGLSWKAARDPSGLPVFVANSEVDSAAFGTNGVYVAVGKVDTNGYQRATIWSSTNGYQWTQTLLAATSSHRVLHAVAYGGGQFVAVGDLGTVATSIDGFTWMETQDPLGLGASNPLTNSAQYLSGIGYGPAGWIALDNLADRSVIRSTNNGATWFLQAAANAPAATTYYHTFYADGVYWFTSTDDGQITQDGTSWTSIPYSSIRRAPDGVNPRFLAGSATVGGAVYGSSDGTNWTQLAAPSTAGVWFNLGSVMAAGNSWVIGGVGCGNLRPFPGPLDDFANGKGWVPAGGSDNFFSGTNLNWSAGAGALPVVGDSIESNGRLLVAGEVGNDAPYLVAGQINLADRSFQGSYLATNSQACPYVAYNPLIAPANQGGWAYVSAGFANSPASLELYAEAAHFNYGGNGYNTVNWGHYFSTNGTNWALRSPGLNDRNVFPGIRGIAWGAGNYVAVGTGLSPGASNTSDRIFTSTDGQNYTPRPPSAVSPQLGNEGLTSVGFNAGAFVAVGNQGRILYSTDGLSWGSPHASDGVAWNRLRYLNNGWAGRWRRWPRGVLARRHQLDHQINRCDEQFKGYRHA